MKLTNEKLNFYLGPIKESYTAFAQDELIRKNSASGGFVSAFLIYLLENNFIQGAVTASTKIENNKIIAYNKISTSREEILESSGSIYMDFDFWKIWEELKNFPGKLAIVALPCQIQAMNKIIQTNESLKNKIFCTIGLFCGHISHPDLIHLVLKKNQIKPRDISRFKFRKGHWRGKMEILLKNGHTKTMSFKKFSLYQNLFFLSREKCFSCTDHLAEQADISVGDIWIREFKNKKIKQSLALIRNEKFISIFNELKNNSIIQVETVNKKTVFAGQKRSLIFQKHIKARMRVGKIFGYKIYSKDSPFNKCRWNDILAAFFILTNIKLSNYSWFRKLLIFTPDFVWIPYLYLTKLLVYF